ncbi:protease [Chitinophaga agrisoli]|uniref:Protease n=1 Tax=Chitinophaga agrisoli TaxID=2607653 RepID=A0A5B2VWG4_9BACT|nr:protease [Chitinophaga agrisoli]KAA2242990.1 protease [Chitinophaga agrisoli]
MKNSLMITAACLSFVTIFACNNGQQEAAATTDSTVAQATTADTAQAAPAADTTAQQEANPLDSAAVLETTMSVKSPIKGDGPIMLKFSVANPTDNPVRFCKWHTPFENFMASYLDITDSKGEAVQYRGAMAKRIMPPPADAYIVVSPKGSVEHEIDLRKGYGITAPGKYKVVYQASGMSGLTKVNELTFEVTK